MSAVAFDTLKFVKRLEAGGVTPAQAEATAEAFSEAIAQDLPTKADLGRVEQQISQLDQRVTHQFVEFEQRMNHQFIELEQRMTIKLGTFLVAAIGIIVTLQHLWR